MVYNILEINRILQIDNFTIQIYNRIWPIIDSQINKTLIYIIIIITYNNTIIDSNPETNPKIPEYTTSTNKITILLTKMFKK